MGLAYREARSTLMEIQGKTVIVTGAARGIGRGIAEAFAQEGASVVLADLGSVAAERAGSWNYELATLRDLATTAIDIREQGGTCLALEVDVADRASCQNLIERSVEAFGRLDVIVNNAGIFRTGTLADFAESDWDRIFAVNVKGIFLLSQAALPHLKEHGGVIINIASVLGRIGFPLMGAYCASKFAAIGLTQSMAAELAEYDIRVNAICPGNVDTAMTFAHLANAERLQRQYQTGTVEDTFDAFNRDTIPLGRGQTPEDMAGAALYLTRADNVTGISLVVDGGYGIGVT